MHTRLVGNLRSFQTVTVNASQFITVRPFSKSYATGLARFVNIKDKYFQLNQSHHKLVAVHLPVLNATVNYSTAKPKSRKTLSVDVILERLETHYESAGFLNSELFDSLLVQLEAAPDVANQLLTTEQIHLLLAGCGTLLPSCRPAERLQLFQRLWDYLARNHMLTTAAHYYTHLQVLRYNRGTLPDFRYFLQEIMKLDKNASATMIYNELLEVACCSGNMRQATEILAEMRTQNMALEEGNFNALILGHGRNGDLAGCQSVLENMEAAGVTLSSETHANLAIAYIENGESIKAADLLDKYHRQLDVQQVLKILRSALAADPSPDFLLQVVREFPEDYLSSTELPVDLRNICIEGVHNGKLDTVAAVIFSLPPPKFNENQDVDTYGVFIVQALFNAEIERGKIIEICERLRESGKNTRALHIAVEIASRRSPPMALLFLQALAKLEPLRPHYFWPLMMYNFRRNGESGIIQTLRHMKQLQVECDLETLKAYVLPRLSIALENPVQTVKMLDNVGLKPSQTLSPIIAHTLAQQKLEETYKLIELYPTKLDVSQFVIPLSKLAVNVRASQRYQQYTNVLAALAKKSDNPKVDFIGLVLVDMISNHLSIRKDPKAVHNFIDGIQKSGLTISSSACDILQSAIQSKETKGNDVADKSNEAIKTLLSMRNRQLTMANEGDGATGASSSFIKHPRDMSLEELECHLIELETKRMNVRGVLRRLLQVCVRDNRLERALEIKAKCDELRVQVSPGMMASIFDMYIKLKDFQKADQTLKQLLRSFPGFQIDEHKMIDYTALLVQENKLELAKQLLKDRANKQKIVGGDYVLKNIWNFLTSVAQLAATIPDLPKDSNLTHDTFVFLNQLGYCKPHNAILGPIVREYLLRRDIRSAVDEFRQLAEKYRHTPLQFELFSLLVRLSNADPQEMEQFNIDVKTAQELLTEVSAIVKKIHGVINMNSSLLLAIAESGTENQLRRLLINPEFRINQEFLMKNCEHMGAGGAVPTLLRLARASRGLHHVIDEQNIYNMLLDNFVKLNDYEAALILFDRLEMDDELKISQDFMRKLVNLLRFNNVEIPSKISLKAQVI